MFDKPFTTDPAIDKFLRQMDLPPVEELERMRRKREEDESHAPHEGDLAPEFKVELLGLDGARSEQFVSLSQYRGRPLALNFGNYTCPVWRGQIERFNEIYERFSGDVQFLAIYVKEAHPSDGWQVGINEDQDVVFAQPVTADERARIAHICRDRMNLKMPLALDSIDDAVEQTYCVSPERLFVVDRNGVITHRSISGPFNLDIVATWERAIEAVI